MPPLLVNNPHQLEPRTVGRVAPHTTALPHRHDGRDGIFSLPLSSVDGTAVNGTMGLAVAGNNAAFRAADRGAVTVAGFLFPGSSAAARKIPRGPLPRPPR